MAVMNLQSEQAQGLMYSIGLHVGLVLLLVFASGQAPVITPPKGVAIQAEIMDLDQLLNQSNKPKQQRPQQKPKPPKPKTEKPKPKPPKAEPKIEPKPVEKPVIKPKVDPSKRQEKTERQKRLEEIRRKRQEAEAQAKQQPDVKPAPDNTETQTEENSMPPVGVENGAEDAKRTKLTLYTAAIKAAVTRSWTRPVGTPVGLQCQIKVNQIPGGGVINVSIGTPCNASAVVRNSIVNAVKKADPLPYKGFEDVFDRRITFNFQYQGD